MNRKYILWVVLFVFLTICPMLFWPAVGNIINVENIDNNEKDKLPKFTAKNYDKYTELLEKYYNSKLPFKDLLITGNAILDYFVFGDSPSKDVIKGDNGWLFYGETMEDYKKTNLSEDWQLQAINDNLNTIKNYLNERGIELYVFVAPNKATIYGEDNLPYKLENDATLSRTEDIVKYIKENSDLNIIFPKEELIELSKKNPDETLYYKKDTHWNHLGAYYGSKILLKEMGIDLPEREEFEIKEVNEPLFSFYGYDLANMTGLTNVLTKDVNYDIIGYTDKKISCDGDIRNKKYDFSTYVRVTSDATDDRKVFFIRDSFGTAMLPCIASCFSEIYSPNQFYMSLDQIDREQPDIVIIQMVERYDLGMFSISAWSK